MRGKKLKKCLCSGSVWLPSRAQRPKLGRWTGEKVTWLLRLTEWAGSESVMGVVRVWDRSPVRG